jgi:D-3-phosphoglycerate dehydrogenase
MATPKILRLNAQLFPVGAFEASLYRRYEIEPIGIEADTPAAILAHAADCDALFAISVALSAEVVNGLAQCRVISRLGAGTDKIAVDVATQRGIVVTNVPTFCMEEQADHTMALLLSLVRRLPQMQASMRAGAYSAAHALSRSNRRLAGRTIGLVGFGYSARLVAQRALGFGMRVIATRRRNLPGMVGVEMADLTTVLQQSDYVSLHLPLTAATYHIIDAAALRLMRPEALLINTSRGALVDEAALEHALREGRLAGAGLDTFEGVDVFVADAPPPTLALLQHPNVIATPHVAAGSVESGQDVSAGGVENLVAILRGTWPRLGNVVNGGVVPRFPLKEFLEP